MIESFGTKGHRRSQAGRRQRPLQQIDLETGEIGIHSTPIVVRDIAIVGSAMREGATVETPRQHQGHRPRVDVRTGKMIWQFDTIPRPVQFGNDTVDQGVVGEQPATSACGRRSRLMKSSGSSICRSKRRLDYYGGHRPETTSSPKASCASI
jgi:quinoprotein glucose dehydrogenase